MRLDKFVRDVSAILEAPYSGWVGAMGRPDADYVGQAYRRRPEVEPKDYPYDRDDDGGTMTSPRISGFGQGRAQGKDRTLVRPLTPVNKGRTEYSGFEEASGTPMNFAMSGRGGSQLGNPAPGMGGDWAHQGPKPWDEDEEEKFSDTVQAYDEEHEVLGMTNDGEPEASGDFVSFPSVLMQVVGSGFGNGLGKSDPTGRGFMDGWTEDLDVMASEGAWARLVQMLGL